MLKIKDLKTLRKLTANNKENELALVEETRTLYKWDGVNWNVHKPEGGIQVSLYELNQNAMTGLPELTKDEIKEKKIEINNFVANFHKAKYFMLLSNERKYYTIFSIGHSSGTHFDYLPIEDEVIDCLEMQGKIKDISLADNAMEFWVTAEDNSYVYYLFNYDEGVIRCQ